MRIRGIATENHSAEAQAEWRAEVAAINLGRLRWLWLASLVMTALLTVATFWIPTLQPVHGRIGFDVGCSLLMMLLTEWTYRQPRYSPWRTRIVHLSMVVGLMWLTTWYFEALPWFGNNSDYVLGVIIASATLLVPPHFFTIALISVHILYCALLVTIAPPPKILLPALIDGTVAAVVSWFVLWFLYRAREAEFHRARALAASNEELREVMAIAAHDLRSPLLGLRDLISIGRREPGVEGMLARLLEQASQTCGAMIALVSRLVEAHAAERPAQPLLLLRQDLRWTCVATIERLRPTAEKKGQRLTLLLPSGEAEACIDATTFSQVLENLVSNALKFSPADSAVEIELLPSANGNAWQIEVRDSGPGVPANEEAQLFAKFYRGSARPTGGEASTGLGLFIVRTLTEAMGGHVSYARRDPQGAVFRLEWAKAG